MSLSSTKDLLFQFLEEGGIVVTKSERGSVVKYYNEFYRQMIGHDAAGILRHLWQYPHRLMEAPFHSNKGMNILEVGAGEGEHIAFTTPDYTCYTAVDIDQARLNRVLEMRLPNVNILNADAIALPFSDSTFNRVIATCLLAHLQTPESALEEWRRVLKPGGALTIYIPAEPGLALRCFRNIFTRPKARRLGFKGYNLFIARDHINSAARLLCFVDEIFVNDKIVSSFRPLFLRSWYLNLFIIVQVTCQE